ncbi:maleylpyruvate isomerase family mycothiol-dependent enzyme [Rhodococcus sp. 114MFTsu3.1]|uniref:maleylpyruvate isomerase family mycothiol-dependent enzyme n=1 Tax=Rhodococcus sp. 114MFTsu3.1 TaxID=1172184 RepID=UPI0003620E35|nr:maleylpyruvate isomerase family mycothiol-dependent enzyme [Rhodococcus sp. 114MFTsu3.1]
MTLPTFIDVAAIPRIEHREAMQITSVESDKFAAALRALRTDDWSKPTVCQMWDVHAVAAHIVGSAAGQASPREFVRQVRTGKPLVAEIGGEFWWDGMNELQVRERATSSPDELIAEWDTLAPAALKSRSKLPRPIAKLPLLNLPEPVGRQPIAYLFDVGFTRDVWMHRVDITRAAGTELDIDAAHDGRLVADIVAEWAGTHGQPFDLTLTGPAGGSYRAGSGGEAVEIDAVEFCSLLSGRGEATGLLSHPLPL